MARTDGEQNDIFDAIVKALIDNIDGLSDKNCFISVYPSPPYKVPDNFFITVGPTAGTFDEDMITGGAQNQCTEDTSALVTMFSRFQCMRPGQERNALNDQSRGLLRYKRLILKALCSLDVMANTNLVLRNMLTPKRSGAPEYVGDEQLLSMSLEFAVSFDWDLTA